MLILNKKRIVNLTRNHKGNLVYTDNEAWFYAESDAMTIELFSIQKIYKNNDNTSCEFLLNNKKIIKNYKAKINLNHILSISPNYLIGIHPRWIKIWNEDKEIVVLENRFYWTAMDTWGDLIAAINESNLSIARIVDDKIEDLVTYTLPIYPSKVSISHDLLTVAVADNKKIIIMDIQ